jgi:arylsulfatase A-like enzyme
MIMLRTLLMTFTLTGIAAAADAPNVVFILADDLGRHDCTFMGGPVKTPNLDALANAGVRLDAHYVQPVCSPTRAALLTGRYPMRHGLQTGVVRPWAQYGLPLEEQTLPQALKDAGYATGIVGKWHLGHHAPEFLPLRRGFDYQYGHYNGALDYFKHDRDGGFDWHENDKVCRDDGYSTHLIGAKAAKFVTDHAGKKPYFLYVPFNAVHTPHQVPAKYTEPYADLKGERKTYAGMLAAMDEAVGAIVKAVDASGTRNKTLFIFSSDNGGPAPGRVTDNGPWRAGKGTVYEGGVRVVAFATWQGVLKPGLNAEAMHMVDWYPTLLKLGGANVEQKLPVDGLDAWPMLAAGAKSPHESLLLNTAPNVGALRAGDWKLVVHTGEKDPDIEATAVAKGVELYDLKADPSEKTNLASTKPEKVKELQALLDGYAKQAVPPKAKPKPKGFVSPKVWGEKG